MPSPNHRHAPNQTLSNGAIAPAVDAVQAKAEALRQQAADLLAKADRLEQQFRDEWQRNADQLSKAEMSRNPKYYAAR